LKKKNNLIDDVKRKFRINRKKLSRVKIMGRLGSKEE
jgi:hypothetical protein